MNEKEISILVLEDNKNVVRQELERFRIVGRIRAAHDRDSFERELTNNPDIIVAAFSVPNFGALPLLRMLRDRHVEIPVVIISSAPSEKAAVEAFEPGAVEVLSFEDQPFRLRPTIERLVAQRQITANLRQKETLLRMASRVARIGAWSVDLPDFAITWSEEVRAIHEVPPDYIPTLSAGIEFYIPEHRQAIRTAVESCVQLGTPFDLELQILTARRRVNWVRVMGEAMRDGDGVICRLQGAIQDISGQKKEAERTTQLARRLALTLESITDAFYALDSQWRFAYVNHEAERLLQRSRHTLLGRNVGEEFPDARNYKFEGEYKRAIAERKPVTFEEFYKPLELWVEVRAFPSDEGVAVYFRDVTERRREEKKREDAERALRESEERYRVLFVRNPQPMWVFDCETTRILAVNAAAIAKYGYSEAEFLAMSIDDLRATEDVPRLRSMLQEFPPAGKVGTWRHRKKSGEVIDVEITGDTTEFAKRKARLILVNDITERLRAEDRLARQAALIDRANDAIVVFGLDQVIQFWSHGAERLYGWTTHEAVGRSRSALMIRNPEHFAVGFHRVTQTGDWNGELDFAAKDGRAIVVAAGWSLLRDNSGAPEAVLAIETDITERKKVEAQFLRTQRLESVGTLAGGIAHDLNNLLAPIVLGVELLQRAPLEPKDRKIVETIERSAERASQLARQVLSFARGVEGARMIINVRHLMREIESIIEDTFPKNIRLTPDIANDITPITGDPTQLNQVLLNLCVNARDAMPSGGGLTIVARNEQVDEQFAAMQRGCAPGNYVVIQVTDTGSGISKANLERIFEPFFTTKDVGKGTGLGLSTALGIVRSHHGFMNVDSEPNAGTTFRVYLPASGAAEMPSLRSAKEAAPPGDGECILLVDDEPSIRLITQQTLEEYGYRVLVAEDGAQAIGKFAPQRSTIAAVLTDLMMPLMDGHALIAAIRYLSADVPIIAMTGLDTKAELRKAGDAGVRHFISKPFSAETLLTTVRAAILRQP